MGRVRDADGNHVAGVVVRALDSDSRRSVSEVRTTGDGTFALGALRGDAFDIRVETPVWGKYGEFAWAKRARVAVGGTPLAIVLLRSAVVEGRVVNEAGEGVPGLPIGTRESWAVTGEGGAFEIRGLRGGRHGIAVQAWPTRTGLSRLAGADVVEAGTRGIELRATP